MVNNQGLAIHVVYAQPASVWQASVYLPAGSTVRQALELSRFASQNPAYRYDGLRVGIFGRECSLDHTLTDGDRIEVYRPLTFDPMESRRRRAIHRKASDKA